VRFAVERLTVAICNKSRFLLRTLREERERKRERERERERMRGDFEKVEYRKLLPPDSTLGRMRETESERLEREEVGERES